MTIKHLFPMVLMIVTPTMGMAQSKSGIEMKNLDKTVRPADNFYQYATGGWQKLHPLPAAYGRYGSFDLLQENNNKRINTILTDLLKKKYQSGTIEQKLSDFYRLAMDSTRRDKDGIAPLQPILNEMESAKSVDALMQVRNKYAAFGWGMPFGIGFGADERNAKMNILNVYQGGLTMGQKEYYLDNDEATAKIRAAYKDFVVKMFQLYGFSAQQAQAKRDAIMRLETTLAIASKNNTELRDPQANYNKFTLKEFQSKYPNIQLEAFLNAEGVKSEYFQEMVVGQPTFVSGANALLGLLSADELRAYMEWNAIVWSSSYLSSATGLHASISSARPCTAVSRTSRSGSALRRRLSRCWARPLARSTASATSPLRARSAWRS